MTVQVEALETDTPDEDPLIKATTGKSYFMDQLYLFEAAGALVYVTRSDAGRQIPLLEAVAGPLMQGLGSSLQSGDPQAVLSVHHHLLALGNFAKGFPQVGEEQLETLPYQAPFKQMTEALLQALEAMKTQRVVRDSARFAFSQFVNAIGTTVAELVPQFVQKVVTEFEPAELIDFMTFLGLLIHRLKVCFCVTSADASATRSRRWTCSSFPSSRASLPSCSKTLPAPTTPRCTASSKSRISTFSSR